jgi:serine phosphatase RsbU (regulator of sigma subunit)
LRLAGEPVGVLFLVAEHGETAQPDLDLLGLVADRTVLAIAHAELRDRGARLAQALQRALLPGRLPDHPRVEQCVRHRAVVRDAEVGGDFYDALVLDDGRIGLCIGDVTGKGLRAAATMGRLRSTLRAFAMDGSSPASVLDRLDRFMADEEDVATALYLVLDPETGEGVLANAGHPPPLALGAGGETADLRAGLSTPLGTGERDRPEAAISVPAGGRLLLYTDGLVERRSRGLSDGFARLHEQAATPGLDLEGLCDHLLEVMEEDGYLDDVALLTLRRR